LVHTGQHYDYEMSQIFFDELEIQRPNYFLGVGSASHAVQTARIMMAFEEVCLMEAPEIVVVVGDVNSTMAAALVAKKIDIKIAHVEAGLRSHDPTMPEEINRRVTDVLSDFLFVSEHSGIFNLRNEGKPDSSIHFVGNVMIDTLYFHLSQLSNSNSVKAMSPQTHGPFAVLTLHRPSNVDREDKLKEIFSALAIIARDLPIYFPVHPRTQERLQQNNLLSEISQHGFTFLPPLSYLNFLRLWKDAVLVLTDSGGLQEETTALGIPCITIRENTERPITVEEGTNILAGTSSAGILSAYADFKSSEGKKGSIPALWDGKAAERIAAVLTSI